MTLKLSEAMRLGAMMKPQGHGDLVAEPGGTCAIGAALDACGVALSAASLVDAYDRWELTNRPCKHPVHGGEHWDVLNVIVDLNDLHRWTREEIADWIATIEPVEQSQASERRSLSDAVDVVDANVPQAVHARV